MAARFTDAHARNAKAKAKPYKLTDGNGLFLLVQPNGSHLWRYRYRIGGKENLFAVGEYPQMNLRQAREARDAARRLVIEGIHPAKHRKAGRLITSNMAANTFEAIARELIEARRNELSADAVKQLERVFKEDVYPHVGGLPIKAVTAAHLLAILQRVEKRGAPTIALLIRRWCSVIFCYAVSTLRADADPAAALKGAITRPRVQHKKTLSQKELPAFLKQLEQANGAEHVQIALQLLLLTFVRPSELRCASWSEFDLDAAQWRIPKERMKMREPHIVPLSKEAVAHLKRLKKLDMGRPLLFPNVRDPKRPMSATTMNRALGRMGYSGRFSAHGFRATASTLLNEMGYRPDVIERQLAHRERNQVRASYNHAAYLAERKTMMQDWSNFLNQIRKGNKVLAFRKVSA